MYQNLKFVVNYIKKEIVEKFVGEFYRKNKAIIEKNIDLYEINWNKKEKTFYKLVKKIFTEIPWPKGKYIAYSTMWGMYPRFLEDKTFQVPYKHKNPKYVNVIIAHEMLHFIFYDYFYKKYPGYRSKKYNLFVWHISEIFNVIVQNSNKWMKVFKLKTMPYPEHKKVIKKLKEKYKSAKLFKANDLIDDIIKAVANSDFML